jgi:hypothetical protein
VNVDVDLSLILDEKDTRASGSVKFALALKTYIILCLISVISGCSAKHAALEGPTVSGASEVIVSGITYDDKGLPVMGAFLSKRPSKPGDHFSVIRLTDARPVISYDIIVRHQKPDFAKPFQAVYEWTGKGFILGANISAVMLQGIQAPHDKDAAAIELAIIITPLAAGTAGGFVVGLADGIRQTALELSKVVVNGEVVVTCTTYEYDALNRLKYMRMLTPDRKQVLVLTEFVYEGTEALPSRTVVKSLAEGKEREVK